MNQTNLDRDLLPPDRRILSGNTFDRPYDYGCAIERQGPKEELSNSWTYWAYFAAVAIAVGFAVFALFYSRTGP